ncbi:MAG: hypothetical protein AB7S26_00990 [Sandaracinaceae bacterium]
MEKPRIRLEVLDIPEPCTVPWETMRGDDRVRFCSECRLNVFDLSALSREAAEELVAANNGSLCVQLTRRADGTVVTEDCAPVRLALLRRGVRRAFVGTAALFTGLLSAGAALASAVGFASSDAAARAEPRKTPPAALYAEAPMLPMQPIQPRPPVEDVVPVSEVPEEPPPPPPEEEPPRHIVRGRIAFHPPPSDPSAR